MTPSRRVGLLRWLNNRLRPDFSVDGIHITGAGYEVWRKAIEPFVNEQ